MRRLFVLLMFALSAWPAHAASTKITCDEALSKGVNFLFKHGDDIQQYYQRLPGNEKVYGSVCTLSSYILAECLVLPSDATVQDTLKALLRHPEHPPTIPVCGA